MGLPEVLRDLMTQRYGERGQSALSRASAHAPDGAVDQGTISRLLSGQNRHPTPETLRSLAWALGESEERTAILERLRVAAGFTAQEPPRLYWPSAVDKLSHGQRRWLQRVVNSSVELALDADDSDMSDYAAGTGEWLGTWTLSEDPPSRREPSGDELRTIRDSEST